MATLGNLLKLRGGLPFTHKLASLTLLIPVKDGGAPSVQEQQVALLPVSHAAEARANRAAIDYESMRDPDDLATFFVEHDHVETFRESIVGEQLDFLLGQYAALLQEEFLELQAKPLKEEARSVFPSG